MTNLTEQRMIANSERLLGQVSLELATPVKCVRLLAGLTLGQLADKVALQKGMSFTLAAAFVEKAERSKSDVSVKDFMIISEACGLKANASLFTKD